jgi:S-adenosylmethionine hydrolase
LAPAVVVAVVDPGVGTARRGVALQTTGGLILVGPDNGLLTPAAHGAGKIAAVVQLPAPAVPPPGATFAGRDVFAPAAARLAAGEPLAELGPPVDPASLVGGPLPEPRVEAGALHAEVLWIDRFGNAQLNVTPDDAETLGPSVRVDLGGRTEVMARVRAYAEISAGRLGLVTDSYGLLALSRNQGSAAAELGVEVGDPVVLHRAEANRPQPDTIDGNGIRSADP